MGAVLMQTQHVARRSSGSSCFAAFPSQNSMILSSAYRDIRNSVILRQRASVEARISHERLVGENTPPELEQNDRSKECLRRLKPFAHLALWSQFRPAAATRPPMMNMLLLTQLGHSKCWQHGKTGVDTVYGKELSVLVLRS